MKSKRLLSLLLAAAMLFGPATLTASAAGDGAAASAPEASAAQPLSEPVSYYDPTDARSPEKSRAEYLPYEGQTALSDGWYAVDGSFSLSERVSVSGDVNLILCDGAELNANSSVIVPEGSSLTVWGQSGLYAVPDSTAQTRGTGVLSAQTGSDQAAAIGGEKGGATGSIVVNGGVVLARGSWGAGIGGGDVACGSGSLTVRGGYVNASGNRGSAGIGGGGYANGCDVTVTGGYVVAVGSSYQSSYANQPIVQAAAGIGAGRPRANGSEPRFSGTIRIFGGTVLACSGTGADEDKGAQAIGVNAKDAENNGTEYLILGGVRAYDSETAEAPVPAAGREDACRGPWVRLEHCEQHADEDSDSLCDFCGVLSRTVPYYDPTDSEQPEKGCSDCLPYTGGSTLKDGGWYVVEADGELVSQESVTVNGTVNVILSDGATWNALNGVRVPEGSSLTVWGQTEGSGGLTAVGGTYFAAIGGGKNDAVGAITINGGTVTATGGTSGAGIGGGSNNAAVGAITINGGTVTATGGISGAGIGSGYQGAAGTVTINGGVVNATGGPSGAGIGGGGSNNAVGGAITINGGTVTATGGTSGAGIGGGYRGAIAAITINGGTVTANGGPSGAGIGSGGYGLEGCRIVINNGSVSAYGKDLSAGIGGGSHCSGGEIAITGGVVEAVGGVSGVLSGAGIGGGYEGGGGNISVTGGTVTACAENDAQAIGHGSYNDDEGRLEIQNVSAYESDEAAQPVLADRRESCCRLSWVKLAPCGEHSFTGGWDNGDGTHTVCCAYCRSLSDVVEPHSYSNYGCVCGAHLPVPYCDPVNESNPNPVCEAFEFLEYQSSLEDGGWYVLKPEAEFHCSSRVRVNGEVNIILCDNASWIVDGGIQVAQGSSLTIWGQSGNSGTLTATGSEYAAGIGGGKEQSAGRITVFGGTVTASGGKSGAGIGGGYYGNGGPVNVYGGSVTASGGEYGAGIGGGYAGPRNNGGDGGTVTVNGGSVAAYGSNESAGIGGGYGGDGGTLTVYDGEVLAEGGEYGAGIGSGGGDALVSILAGGTVTISGGTVTASGGEYGAGIGGGKASNGGTVTISGGTVTASGGYDAAGIGSGGGDGLFSILAGGTVTIIGGTVTASGGEYGAGIGGGYAGNGGTVTISGGTVTASGGEYGAGIGGGYATLQGTAGNGAYVTISGGTVRASAGENAQAIGRGYYGGSQRQPDITDMMAFDKESAAEPVAGTRRIDVCRSRWVKLELCPHKLDEDAYCAWCDQTHPAIPYWDPTTMQTARCGEYLLYKGQTSLDNGKWYAVYTGVDAAERVTALGTINVILMNDAALNAVKGVTVGKGSSLTVWAQSEGTGALSAVGSSGSAGLGGVSGGSRDAGDIVLNGGVVTVTGGENAAAIGGAQQGAGGNVSIAGGTVTAAAGSGAQAIGRGSAGTAEGRLSIPGMRVYGSAAAAEPLPPLEREGACRDLWVKLMRCPEHSDTVYVDGGEQHSLLCSLCAAVLRVEAHSYGEAAYVWAADNSSCCASHSCALCGREESEELSAAVETVTAASCLTAGTTRYTASFTKQGFAVQTKTVEDSPALGHALTQHESRAPSCTEIGWDAYESCSRCGYSSYRELPALGHDWGAPEYYWSDDNGKLTALSICAHNKEHVQTETVKTSFILTQPSTFESTGTGYYSASFENALFAPQRKEIVIPAAACAGDDACPSLGFTDMPPVWSYMHIPIDWAVLNQVTFGVSADSFGPTQSCTRAQFVTFLWRVKGQPEPSLESNPFTDVKQSAYYYKPVLWAVEQGVTAGTSPTSFSPNQAVTRGQVVTFLWRFAGEPESADTQNPFSDAKPAAFYYKAMLWAVQEKITAGVTPTSFAPGDNCTRAQCVTFLYRAQGNT